MSVVCCVCGLLIVVCCLLFVIWCLLVAACCVLFGVGCLSCDVCCSFFCCLLFAGCCCLFVVVRFVLSFWLMADVNCLLFAVRRVFALVAAHCYLRFARCVLFAMRCSL